MITTGKCLGCQRRYQRLGTNPNYRYLCGACALRADHNTKEGNK
jgi:uncharacterized protein YlaI